LGTYGSLHDPNFAFEQRDDTHDDFNRVAKSGEQQASKSLTKRKGRLICGIAEQLREYPFKSRKGSQMSVVVHTLARGMIAMKLNPKRKGASQSKK